MKNHKDFATRSLTILVASAFLAAISIVLGKYLAISLGEVLRISFENLPILIAGIAFGPLWGCVVGVVADLIGCLLVGYAINPVVTLGAATIGLTSGTVSLLLEKVKTCPYVLRIAASVGGAHILGSVIIKTIGLAVFYAMPIHILMLWRLLNYVLVGAAEGVIIWYLLKSPLLTAQIDSILKRSRKTKAQNETEDKSTYKDE